MKAKRGQDLLAAALLCVGLALPAFAQEHTVTDSGTIDKATADKVYPSKPPYSPYVGRNFPTRPFFGDTHLHTAMSFDAGMFGARLGPVDAYRFARCRFRADPGPLYWCPGLPAVTASIT